MKLVSFLGWLLAAMLPLCAYGGLSATKTSKGLSLDTDQDGRFDYQVGTSSKYKSIVTYGKNKSLKETIEKIDNRTIFSSWKTIQHRWTLMTERTVEKLPHDQTRILTKTRTAPNQYHTTDQVVGKSGFSLNPSERRALWREQYGLIESVMSDRCISDIVGQWFVDEPGNLYSQIEEAFGADYFSLIRDQISFQGCSEVVIQSAVEGLEEGISCLEGLGGDGPSTAAQLLGIIFNGPTISRPPGNKVNFSCGNFANMGSQGFSPGMRAQAAPPCDSGYPHVGINTSAENLDPSSRKFQATVFHEFMHLTGRGHVEGEVDGTYMCQMACFGADLPVPGNGSYTQEQIESEAEYFCQNQEAAGGHWDQNYATALLAVTSAAGGGPDAALDQLVQNPSQERVIQLLIGLESSGTRDGRSILQSELLGSGDLIVSLLSSLDLNQSIPQMNNILRQIYSIFVIPDSATPDLVERVDGAPQVGILTEHQFAGLRKAVSGINGNFEQRISGYTQLNQIVQEHAAWFDSPEAQTVSNNIYSARQSFYVAMAKMLRFSCSRDHVAQRGSTRKAQIEEACVRE